MEYEFIYDPITGAAKANFSLEHEVIGPWLETEVGQDADKLTHLLSVIANTSKRKQHDILVTGHEYSTLFSEDDVTIQTNASMNGAEMLPDSLQDEQIAFDQNDVSACGIEDFRELLLSWANFIKKP